MPTDPAANFDEAFPGLWARALPLARRLVRPLAEAEDVAAEALARAYLAWPRLRGGDHQEAWVLRVVTNLALDSHRASARHRRIRAAQPAGSPARFPEAEIAEHLDLERAIGKLPRRQRQVLALRQLADLSDAEVAAVLGLSVNSVKTHAARGMQKLREDNRFNDREVGHAH